VLTVDEYRQERRQHDWRAARLRGISVGWYVIIAAMLDLGFWILLPQLRIVLSPEQLWQCGIGIIVLSMFTFLLAPILIDRREKADIRLHCPTCRRFMKSASLVIASRNCPHCGSQALSHDHQIETTAPLPTWEEWKTLRRARSRSMTGSLLALLTGAVLIVPVVFLMFWMRSNPPQPSLWTVILGGQFVILVVIAPLGLIPGLLPLLSPGERRDSSRACPHCDEQMREEVIRLSGNCSACGRAVLSLADVAASTDQHRYSTAKALALFRCYKRLVFEGIVIFLGLFVTAAFVMTIFFPPDSTVEKGGFTAQRLVIMVFTIAMSIMMAVLWVGPRYRCLDACCPSCHRKLRDLAHREPSILATNRCPECRALLLQ
jgi:ssDNA-binding Zn-finger/Zn-ribbon topoisomerase 1